MHGASRMHENLLEHSSRPQAGGEGAIAAPPQELHSLWASGFGLSGLDPDPK